MSLFPLPLPMPLDVLPEEAITKTATPCSHSPLSSSLANIHAKDNVFQVSKLLSDITSVRRKKIKQTAKGKEK